MVDLELYQCSIFDELFEKKVITKKIRLIELFSGIGAQAKALEILNIPFEHYLTCEWAYNSIVGYNAIHIKDKTDYAKDMTKEQLLSYLNGNISIDYNKPADLTKKPIEWLKNCYNNVIATHDLMNIMNVKGRDLGVFDKDYEYILTYSFPCQDLSLAGKRSGMETSQSEGGTRSGLLWEVERILLERKRNNLDLPGILLMENVPEVVGTKNDNHFYKWCNQLSKLGYQNYFKILNAKNYGIPQNRKRCFMISILGDYTYDFPKKLALKHKLKDLLDKNVDEKYYLSKKMINYISSVGTKNFNNHDSKINLDVARPLTTENNKRAGTTNYISDDLPKNTDLSELTDIKKADILLKELVDTNQIKELPCGCDSSINEPKVRDISNCITARYNAGIQNQKQIGMCVVEEYNNKRLNETIESNNVKDGDFIDAYNKTVNSEVAGTITTRVSDSNCTFIAKKENDNVCNELVSEREYIPIKNDTKQGYLLAEEGDGIDISGRMQYHRGNVQKETCQTLTTGGDNVGVVVKEEQTLKKELRIRKLTPCECIKLMGFERKDYESLVEYGLSDSAIYHCAGDSIVATVLVGLFGTMTNKDYEQIIKDYTERITND